MQNTTNPASPLDPLVDNLARGAARASSLFSSLLGQNAQRRHDLLMKHGHPLPGKTRPHHRPLHHRSHRRPHRRRHRS